MKVFISYSHKDASYLDRLHTHLAVLRREGSIKAWFDREILAGGELNSEISEELEGSEIFLALISPDFLASNYCYEEEMQKAIARHDAGKTRVVPIIVEPCEWQKTPLIKFKAIPRDGKPIAEWQNQNTAFLDVVTELRRIVTEKPASKQSASPKTPAVVPVNDSGRRYRVKRDFDKVDRTDFRDQAFKTIRDYIRSSITEIDGIEDIRARYTDINAYSFTCLIINRAKERGEGAITVHSGGSRGMMGEIYYSFSENAPANTANGGFSVDADDYELYLKPDLSIHFEDDERLTALQAAKIIWDQLLEKAGIIYA